MTYWDVELDNHDILLAEEFAGRELLDKGNRGFLAEESVVSLAASP